jgi:quinoprotein glucose dehydrogenase
LALPALIGTVSQMRAQEGKPSGTVSAAAPTEALDEKELQLEDPAERMRLPEFRVIPAAKPSELTPASAIPLSRFSTWTRSQGDEGSRRYSSLTQIDRNNVKLLRPAWIFHSGDGHRNIEATPIIVEDILYGLTAGRAIVALNAATGKEIWRVKLEEPANPGMEDEPARRGLVYWAGYGKHMPRILVGNGDWIYALDARSGRRIEEFGSHGRTPLPTGATVGGAIYKYVYVTAGIRGDVFGYDVRTGKALWCFHTVPTGSEFGADTWSGPQPGAAVCWGGLSIDEGRGIVYPAIGAAHPDFVGVGRNGDNLFGDSVLALDALTSVSKTGILVLLDRTRQTNLPLPPAPGSNLAISGRPKRSLPTRPRAS